MLLVISLIAITKLICLMLFTCNVASHFHVSVFHHLGLGSVSVFKLFIFTVVKNFALNKGTRNTDEP